MTGPWCYLEFGNVRWCRDPHLLDARLRKAALAIAGDERSFAASHSGAEQHALLGSATLLQRANDNGELFLALPANGAARNSINESGSLLSVLCGGSREATHCEGPSAEEAEFRTQHGTWPRVVGLLLIWIGALAALALFGWIGLRLLAAALLSLLLLLLAPAAVLAPALGEGGRVLFRTWGTRLIAAVTAKLVYSVLLGAALLMTNLLAALSALGWWAQWLLIAAGWWLAFHERHELLGLARVGDAAPWARRERAWWPATRDGAQNARARDASTGGRGTAAPVTWRGAGSGRRPDRAAAVAAASRAPKRARERSPTSRWPRPSIASTVKRARESRRLRPHRRDLGEAGAAFAASSSHVRGWSRVSSAVGSRRAGGEGGLAHARATRRPRAAAGGADRRGAGGTRRCSRGARRRSSAGMARGGRVFSDERVRQRARFYDEQAALPEKGRRDAAGRRRDYRRLARLTGRGEGEWDELGAEETASRDTRDRRRARKQGAPATRGATAPSRHAWHPASNRAVRRARIRSVHARLARRPARHAHARTRRQSSRLAGRGTQAAASARRRGRWRSERVRSQATHLSAEQLRRRSSCVVCAASSARARAGRTRSRTLVEGY